MRLPPVLLIPLLLGSVAALAGGYWDDAWHTERGRDGFFIAPHIAIYGGISLAGAALSLWVVLAVRGSGTAALRHGPLALALVAVAATLSSGPIDNVWHVAFGRDAVIWSPPHTLGIVGTAALGVALLTELADRQGRWASWARPVAGAFVVAALTFLVVEYETDVPQFDAVWYLPVLGLTSALALGMVRRVGNERWAAGAAAAVQFAFVAAVGALLLALGFDAPRLPLLIGAALVLDFGSARRAPVWLQAVGFTTALYLLYPLALGWLGKGVELAAGDILIGFPLTFVGVFLALGVVLGDIHLPRVRPRSVALLALGVLAVVVLAAPPAFAHDPGQGEEAGELSLSASSRGKRVTLTAALSPERCGRVGRARMVVRRAGLTRAVGMRRVACRLQGTLSVPETGRWFVYAELSEAGGRVESWLPLKVGGHRSSTSDDSRYAYQPAAGGRSPVKLGAGVLLYLLMVALVIVVVRLVRSAAPPGGGEGQRLPRQRIGRASRDGA